MRRPKHFSDIIGHQWLVNYLVDHIKNNTLHHFLIIEGPEGLGKTSIADLIALALVYGFEDTDERERAYNEVCVKNNSNDFIRKYKLSVDGGKDVAREVKADMNATFTQGRNKVIICDECHGLTEQAQDVFLSETEFIPEKVYMIMLTTEVNKLKASLRSRAVPIHLNPLKQGDMIRVLTNEVREKNLKIQNESAMLEMIAMWAECKPRTGLNILNAFANGTAVSSEEVRELIGFMDVRDVLPLISALSGSLTFGISMISEMAINNTLIDAVIEILSIKAGMMSYRLKMKDIQYIRDETKDVTQEQMKTFLFELTRVPMLSRNVVLHAFLAAHHNREIVFKPDTHEAIHQEDTQRADAALKEQVQTNSSTRPPSIDDLLRESEIIEI